MGDRACWLMVRQCLLAVARVCAAAHSAVGDHRALEAIRNVSITHACATDAATAGLFCGESLDLDIAAVCFECVAIFFTVS